MEMAAEKMGQSPVSVEKVDESGFFAALVSSKKKLSYTYSVEKVNGEVTEYTDPYTFANVTKPEDYKAFLAGEEKIRLPDLCEAVSYVKNRDKFWGN